MKTVNLVSGISQCKEKIRGVGKTASSYKKIKTITKYNVWICLDPDSNESTVQSHFEITMMNVP